MSKLVFLLEEPSAKALLDGLLPRLFPTLSFLCVPHEGKQDLEKSIPRKLKAWREPGVYFLVLRDNDGGDCRTLKQRLVKMCEDGGRDDSVVRIACQELEAWYIGEPDALAECFNNEDLKALDRKERFRDSDTVMQPAVALGELVPEFQKVSGARRMAEHLSLQRNKSRSFHAVMNAVQQFVTDTSPEPTATEDE